MISNPYKMAEDPTEIAKTDQICPDVSSGIMRSGKNMPKWYCGVFMYFP